MGFEIFRIDCMHRRAPICRDLTTQFVGPASPCQTRGNVLVRGEIFILHRYHDNYCYF